MGGGGGGYAQRLAWMDEDGTFHRDQDDLPAYIFANGNREWYLHGVPARSGGQPHKEYADGELVWE
jgi:hypothetical protein